MEEMLKEMKCELKELKEDRKHDRDMISFLKDRILQAEKSPNLHQDPDLHRKLELVLEKLQNNSNPTSTAKTTVENTQVLLKLDAVLEKIENFHHIEEKLNLLREELEKSQKTVNYFVESYEAKIDNLEMEKADKLVHIDQKTDLIARGLDDLHEEINAFPNMILELQEKVRQVEIVLSSQELEFEELRRDLQIKLSKHLENKCEREEITYKCFNLNCQSVFPKNVHFEADGVSVECPNKECEVVNILGQLQKGHKIGMCGFWMGCICCTVVGRITPSRTNSNCVHINCSNFGGNEHALKQCSYFKGTMWMYTVCNGECHYQQFPRYIKHKGVAKCQVCGIEGTVTDAGNMAIVAGDNMNGVDREASDASSKENGGKKVGKINSILKRNSSKGKVKVVTYTCWNANCRFTFHKKLIHFREDGVSLACPKCHHIPILGKLEEGSRWMSMYCNGKSHYQQFPIDTKHREVQKCGICGIQGETYGANDHVVIRVETLE